MRAKLELSSSSVAGDDTLDLAADTAPAAVLALVLEALAWACPDVALSVLEASVACLGFLLQLGLADLMRTEDGAAAPSPLVWDKLSSCLVTLLTIMLKASLRA